MDRKELLNSYVIPIVVVAVIMGSLYAYAGNWPPMVVVKSGSMMHDATSHFGTLDIGDLTIVKRTSKIVTYVEGRATGHRSFGDFGDVVVYRPDGSTSRIPIIHRALIYVEWRGGHFAAPSLALLRNGRDWVSETNDYSNLGSYLIIKKVGPSGRDLLVDLSGIPHESGYLTFGDHNLITSTSKGRVPQGEGYLAVDQNIGISRHPVHEEWIVGKARGEIPWMGLMKLYVRGEVPPNTPTRSKAGFWTVIAIIVFAVVFPSVRKKK